MTDQPPPPETFRIGLIKHNPIENKNLMDQHWWPAYDSSEFIALANGLETCKGNYEAYVAEFLGKHQELQGYLSGGGATAVALKEKFAELKNGHTNALSFLPNLIQNLKDAAQETITTKQMISNNTIPCANEINNNLKDAPPSQWQEIIQKGYENHIDDVMNPANHYSNMIDGYAKTFTGNADAGAPSLSKFQPELGKFGDEMGQAAKAGSQAGSGLGGFGGGSPSPDSGSSGSGGRNGVENAANQASKPLSEHAASMVVDQGVGNSGSSLGVSGMKPTEMSGLSPATGQGFPSVGWNNNANYSLQGGAPAMGSFGPLTTAGMHPISSRISNTEYVPTPFRQVVPGETKVFYEEIPGTLDDYATMVCLVIKKQLLDKGFWEDVCCAVIQTPTEGVRFYYYMGSAYIPKDVWLPVVASNIAYLQPTEAKITDPENVTGVSERELRSMGDRNLITSMNQVTAKYSGHTDTVEAMLAYLQVLHPQAEITQIVTTQEVDSDPTKYNVPVNIKYLPFSPDIYMNMFDYVTSIIPPKLHRLQVIDNDLYNRISDRSLNMFLEKPMDTVDLSGGSLKLSNEDIDQVHKTQECSKQMHENVYHLICVALLNFREGIEIMTKYVQLANTKVDVSGLKDYLNATFATLSAGLICNSFGSNLANAQGWEGRYENFVTLKQVALVEALQTYLTEGNPADIAYSTIFMGVKEMMGEDVVDRILLDDERFDLSTNPAVETFSNMLGAK